MDDAGTLLASYRSDAAPDPLAPALAGLAERLPFGVAVVDRDGQVLWRNAAARELLVPDGGLARAAGSRLELPRASETRRLQRMIAAAADRPHADSPAGVLAVPRAANGDPVYLVVVGWRATGGGGGSTAGATVLLLDPWSSRAVSPRLLAEAHGLTQAQARLAALLLRGRTIETAARELGVTPGTARCHLRRLFAATRTRRQPDLVRFLLQGVAALRFPLDTPSGDRRPR